MSIVHVIGLGSPFGADDIGWAAARALRRDPRLAALPDGVLAVDDGMQPAALLRAASPADGVLVLLDAVIGAAARAGSVRALDEAALAAEPRLSSHGLGVREALALGRALGTLPPQVRVFGICVPRCGRLDAAARARACAEVAARVHAEVRRRLAAGTVPPLTGA